MDAIKHWQRENYFKLLVATGETHSLSDATAPRLVILVRDDILPPLHQGIQSMHAVVTLAGSVKLDPRCYLILLGATVAQMERAIDKVTKRKRSAKGYAMYSDPGLVDPKSGKAVVTACAFEPMSAEEVRTYFGGLTRAK